MSASHFVGRIGGLAVALGVGALAFGGTSVAGLTALGRIIVGAWRVRQFGGRRRGAQRANKHSGPRASKVAGGVPLAASKGKPVAAPDLAAISKCRS